MHIHQGEKKISKSYFLYIIRNSSILASNAKLEFRKRCVQISIPWLCAVSLLCEHVCELFNCLPINSPVRKKRTICCFINVIIKWNMYMKKTTSEDASSQYSNTRSMHHHLPRTKLRVFMRSNKKKLCMLLFLRNV